MKISKRLLCIAEMIPNKSKVIDVGCDHGLLSIYLEQEKECFCLATDVNPKALGSAKINKKKYNSNIELKLTDGLEDINIDENDYIVIAGMGATTIKNILQNKKLSNNLIIASNNQIDEIRTFITQLGYKIEDEKFIIDHQKNYVIIKFVKGKKRYSNIDLKYGPILRNNTDYMIYELEKLYQIKEKIIDSGFIVKYKNQQEINKVLKIINNEKGK